MALPRVPGQAQHEASARLPVEPGLVRLSLSKATRAVCLSALLAACSSEAGGSGAQAADASETPGASVSCATGGAQVFTDACTVEQARVDGAPMLVIRHADGGFRRFAVTDGSLLAADGADQAMVSRDGDMVAVTVGADRYRIGASLLGNAR